jgi:hypothetical protein
MADQDEAAGAQAVALRSLAQTVDAQSAKIDMILTRLAWPAKLEFQKR